MVPDEEVAKPAPTSPATSAYPALETGTGPGPRRVLSLLTVRILVSRERNRRLLLAALAAGLVVVAIALLLALLCSRTPATRGAKSDGFRSTESLTVMTHDEWCEAPCGRRWRHALVLNELCERHNERT